MKVSKQREPQEAYSVEVFHCMNCSHVHIALKDREDRVFATAVLSRQMVDNIQICQAEAEKPPLDS